MLWQCVSFLKTIFLRKQIKETSLKLVLKEGAGILGKPMRSNSQNMNLTSFQCF